MQQSIAAGDWSGAADQAICHLPFVGPGRSGVEALQQEDPLGAAWNFGVLGLEALPFCVRVPRAGAGGVGIA